MKKFFKNLTDFGHKGGIIAVMAIMIFVSSVSLAGCSTTWLVDLENYLPVAVGVATGVTSILVSSGALGPVIPVEIAAAEAAVTSGLNLLCGIPVVNQCNPTSLVGQLNAGGSVTTEIQNALASLQANISTWLSLVHIKNTTLQATVTAALSLLLSTIAAIAARVGSLASAAKIGPRAVQIVIAKGSKMPLTAKQFKSQYNSIVRNGGFAQYSLA